MGDRAGRLSEPESTSPNYSVCVGLGVTIIQGYTRGMKKSIVSQIAQQFYTNSYYSSRFYPNNPPNKKER